MSIQFDTVYFVLIGVTHKNTLLTGLSSKEGTYQLVGGFFYTQKQVKGGD
nr:MAG TPA: hypothetical protein [Caudoviricetes sp.]